MTMFLYYLKKEMGMSLLKSMEMLILDLVLQTTIFQMTFLELKKCIKIQVVMLRVLKMKKPGSQNKNEKSYSIIKLEKIATLIELPTEDLDILPNKRPELVTLNPIQIFNLIFSENFNEEFQFLN